MTGIPMCPDHPDQDLRLYCLICEKTICILCKIVCHDSHKADLVSTVAKEMRHKLDSLFEKAEKAIKELNERSEKYETVQPFMNIMTEVTEKANEMKREIDTVVNAIESKIRLGDDGNNSGNKIKELTLFKEAILEATENNFLTVNNFKDLIGLSVDLGLTEQLSLSDNEVIGEGLRLAFSKIHAEVLSDIRRLDVHGISKSKGTHSCRIEWFRGLVVTRATLGLEMLFFLFPFIQLWPVLMLMLNAKPDRPHVEIMAICAFGAAAGILMIGKTTRKFGAALHIICLLLLPVSAFFGQYKYSWRHLEHLCFSRSKTRIRNRYNYRSPPTKDTKGRETQTRSEQTIMETSTEEGQKVLSKSRHLGTAAAYLLLTFTTGGKSSTLVKIVGWCCMCIYTCSEGLLFWDHRTEVYIPGGKYTCYIITILIICWKIYMSLNNGIIATFNSVIMTLITCLTVASTFICLEPLLIDPEFKRNRRFQHHYTHFDWDSHNKYTARLYWTILHCFLLNVNILTGLLAIRFNL